MGTQQQSTNFSDKLIEELFEMELLYRQGMEKATTFTDPVRKYLGSGDGNVTGEYMRGTVRWDLFEQQGETACDAHFTGIIETDDGAAIHFYATGYFKRPESGSIWRLSAGALFETEDARYQWLTAKPTIWEGEFDMSAYRHRYRVYTPAG